MPPKKGKKGKKGKKKDKSGDDEAAKAEAGLIGLTPEEVSSGHLCFCFGLTTTAATAKWLFTNRQQHAPPCDHQTTT